MADWKEEGYHSVTPYLIVDDAAAAIEFYKKAFGATEHMRMPMGDKIGHAGATTSLMIYVPDVDAAFDKAVAAGGEVVRAVEDQFYGDRSGWLKDPFGHEWTLSTHVEDVSEEVMGKRMSEMIAGEGA